ncbi:MAG: hypothetical protein NMK33_02270 [Candidatus Cardinium sp.]|uniref:hypothetical protein n=1 Tax=Cardinium endosymbiont of Dermatophagoides farinae TaxID=2597823 RepID=UPI001642C403|nr:hypothetical protein [Cardinium endosymbiont of Dermatophagoides farinae]UWW97367.1 MAG: hypothetical protein NMK33_02270 [Candidatus Cardinium sp.]
MHNSNQMARNSNPMNYQIITSYMTKDNRPSAKPICDQQFLGEAQSSTAEY